MGSGVAFLLREEALTVRNQQPLVASASLVDTREVDLVKNPVAEGEPNLAVKIACCANAGFGAGGPARGNARRAGGKSNVGITQKGCPPERNSLTTRTLVDPPVACANPPVGACVQYHLPYELVIGGDSSVVSDCAHRKINLIVDNSQNSLKIARN